MNIEEHHILDVEILRSTQIIDAADIGIKT
jgi:hypothetical protein